MPDVEDVLSLLEKVREARVGWTARCPAHDDSDPSLWVAEGDKQPITVHCHAGCSSEDIAAALGMTVGDFCEDDSDLAGRVKRKEKQAPRPRVPEKSDAEWAEMRRAWQAMDDTELWLRDQYRRRRAKASHERDRDAFEHWHGKFRTLHDHVLRREMVAHREVDRLDSCFVD